MAGVKNWIVQVTTMSSYLKQTYTSRGLEGVRRYFFYSIGELDSGILSLQGSISSTFAHKFFCTNSLVPVKYKPKT